MFKQCILPDNTNALATCTLIVMDIRRNLTRDLPQRPEARIVTSSIPFVSLSLIGCLLMLVGLILSGFVGFPSKKNNDVRHFAGTICFGVGESILFPLPFSNFLSNP